MKKLNWGLGIGDWGFGVGGVGGWGHNTTPNNPNHKTQNKKPK